MNTVITYSPGNKSRKNLTKKEIVMKRILGVLLLSALFLIGVPHSSYASPCGCQGRGMHEEGAPAWGMGHHREMATPRHHMWKRLRRLGLDEKQKESIRNIRSGLMKKTITKTADVRIAKIDLRDMLSKDSVDMQAVEAKVKEIESLQADLRLSRIKAMLEVKALLTPAQRKKLREGYEQSRERRGFRRSMWHDFGSHAGKRAMQ